MSSAQDASPGALSVVESFTPAGLWFACPGTCGDGAPVIDIIDGDRLLEMLKGLSLGVDTKIIEVEDVSIDKEWFLTL